MMDTDPYTKFIMAVIAFALFQNGLNPWLSPPHAAAKETTAISADRVDADCSKALKNSIAGLESLGNVARVLGYVESSINEVKLTVTRIDRKLNKISNDYGRR